MPVEKFAYRFVDDLVLGVIRHRYLVLFLTVIAACAMSSGLRHATLDHSYKSYLADDHRYRLMIDHMEDNYVKDDNIFLIVRPGSGTVYQPEVLGVMREITEAAWGLSHVRRVDSLNNYQYTYAEGDELIVDDLVPADLELSRKNIERIARIASREPQLRNLHVSEDGGAAAINIIFHYDDRDVIANIELENEFRTMLDGFVKRYPNMEFRHVGIVTGHAETAFLALHDVLTLFTLASVLVILGIYFFLGNWVITIACLAVIALTILSTTGLVGYSRTPFTLPTSSAPIMIMTLAVADSIHILMTLKKLMLQGVEKNPAIVQAVKQNIVAILLTTVTTAIGFLMFNLSSFEPLVGLGNIVSVGIVLALLFSIIFLPAFLSCVPFHIEASSRTDRATQFAAFLADRIPVHRRKLTAISVTACVVAALLLPLNSPKDNMIWFYGPDSLYRQNHEFNQAHLTGSGNLIVAIESDTPDSVHEVEFLERIDAFADWLREQDSVRHVFSYTDALKRINRNLHGDNPDYYRLPESRELASQYHLLYEMSLPYGLDLTNQLNMDKSGIRLVATINDEDSVNTHAAAVRLEEKLSEAFPEYSVYTAGGVFLVNDLLYGVMRDSLSTSLLSFACIGLILIIAFQSLRQGLLGMLGVTCPLVLMFGIWGVFASYVGLAAVIVLGISLGIVVDNSVHLISKFNYARLHHGADKYSALEYSINNVAPALIVNTAVMGIGFFILSFADYTPNATLGVMSAMTFVLALGVCLLLVAPLLSLSGTAAVPPPLPHETASRHQ